jgi:methyl-accepting chemotaxis protein
MPAILQKLRPSNRALGTNMIAIATLFALPITLLIFLFVAQNMRDVAFSAKERDGSTYLDRIWPLFVGAARGTNDAARASEVAAAREASARYDGAMNSGPAVRAFLDALAQRRSIHDVLAAGQAAIQKIGDGSNLILDPDLDSFYLMDAVVVRLPELVTSIQEVWTAAEAATQAPTNEERRIELILAVGRFTAAVPPVAADYESSTAANPAGDVRRALQGRCSAT